MSVMQEKFKAIADKIREKLGITDLIKPNDFVNKIDDVYDAAKEAYGLKHTVTGNPITTSYINPNTHEIKVKTSKPNTVVKKYGKNLISYPYAITTHSKNGLDFIDNGDGTITINGTATADTDFYLTSDDVNIPLLKIDKNVPMFLSGCPSSSGNKYFLYAKIITPNSSYTYPYDVGSSKLIYGTDGWLRAIFIKIKSGAVCDNIRFYPQLEVNSQRTSYTIGTQPMEYISDSEGNITNINVDNHDIMTFTSNDDVNIECKYFKDKNAYWNEEWDKLQSYGSREDYCMAFAYGWTDETFRPKYDIICGSSYYAVYNIFYYSKITNIAECLNKAGVIFDISKCTNCGTMFANSRSRVLPNVNLEKCTTITQAFYNIEATDISIENIKPTLVFNKTFDWSTKIVNITLINCEIGQNGFDVKYCKNLSAQSLYNIIISLSTSTTGLSITLPTTAEANYNANPPEGAPQTWTELIATRSNWTIAYTEV